MSNRQFARGRRAIAECQRSGQKMLYRDLVEDGHITGLLVHPDWWEPKHPQEIPPDVTDPIALSRPAPEISIPIGYGDAENLDGGVTPTTPLGSVSGTTAVAMTVGDFQMTSASAVVYPFNEWLFIELNGGGTYFVSRITTGATEPTFLLPFTSAFAGAADAGNNFYIGVGP